MGVQSSTKSSQLQEGEEGAKQPPHKCFAPGSRWGLCPYPPSYGWMTLTKMWVPICLYCSNFTKFGQLILRKIIKIVATRCQILRLKCTKFDFGLRPRPHWGSLQRSPDPLAGFGGPTSKGRGGERRERGRGGWRRGRGGEEKGRGLSLPKVNFLVTSLDSNKLCNVAF